MKEKGMIFELEDLLSKIEKGSYFFDFLKIRDLEAGVLRLYPGQEDTQEPHSADELYFVVEGDGFIEMGDERKPVKRGSTIFVPAGMNHHFYGNKKELVVLYMFAE